MKIIKFFRLFGFSFVETDDEKNKSYLYYFKKYLMIFYNFSLIILFTSIQIVTIPKINQVFNNFNSKPVMKAIIFLSSFIYCVDFMSGYILSLTRSKKLLMLLKTEDICYVDCSPKLANKLIAFVIFNILLLGSMSMYFSLTIPAVVYVDSQIGRILQIIISIILNVICFGGIFMSPIIYVYICWIIYTQINNFKIKIITSIQVFNSFFSKLLLKFFIPKTDELQTENMTELRFKLLRIINKLRELESLLSPFLLVSLMTNTLTLMASICVFATTKKVFDSFLMACIFAVDFFVSLVKIFIYFHFGEKIPNSFSQLKYVLEELSLKTNFSNDDWKQWVAIKSMKSEFNFTIYSFLKLKRETAITVCSFILQYAVILIQTDVY